MTLTEQYLQEVDRVIEGGPFKDNWGSLSDFMTPEWFKEAKFGIFIHWGVYAVPAFGDEWYPRRMYLTETPEYEHHIKTYGPHKEFGYKDFIPMFRGEKFDAYEWSDLFRRSGARYVAPVAEHHDGFQMYDSDLSTWNAVQMGPHVDYLKEMKKAVEGEGMTFCASSHRAEHYWFFSGGRTFDSGIRDLGYDELYGHNHWLFTQDDQDAFTHIIDAEGPTVDFLEDWLVRTCEIVDKYQPKIIYFDWWIMNLSFKPYLKKFAAYYYNRAAQWGVQVTICYKHDAFALGTAIYDIERGQAADIRTLPWQTDTAIGLKSWGYTEDNVYKKPRDIICNLVDVVSKNGNLMLNVGPKADGTIGDEDKEVLEAIGDWMADNGEGIYGTSPWHIFGEGPTRAKEGYFNDGDLVPYSREDIRFTYKKGVLYAFVMAWPEDGTIVITSLSSDSKFFKSKIVSVRCLGQSQYCPFVRTDKGLEVQGFPTSVKEGVACFEIRMD